MNKKKYARLYGCQTRIYLKKKKKLLVYINGIVILSLKHKNKIKIKKK